MSSSIGNYTVVVDGQKFNVQVAEGADAEVTVKEVAKSNQAKPQDTYSESAAGLIEIPASVPGTVWKILVNPGDEVSKDDTIIILESMKMEIDIKAPQDGIIAHIGIKTNDIVEDGQVLATME